MYTEVLTVDPIKFYEWNIYLFYKVYWAITREIEYFIKIKAQLPLFLFT